MEMPGTCRRATLKSGVAAAAVAAAPCVQPGGDGSSAPAAVPSSADFAREIDELMLSVSSPPATSKPVLSGAPVDSQRGAREEPEAGAAAVQVQEGREEGSEGNAELGDAGGYTLDFDDDAAIG